MPPNEPPKKNFCIRHWEPYTNMDPQIEDFLATVLPKLCQQMELKYSEIRKNKILWDFVVKAIRPRDVP